MTLADKGKTNPYQARDGIVRLLISKTHVHPLTAVREMVSNLKDQYRFTPDKERKAVIEIDSIKKKFSCTDFATGIQDVEDFKYVGNESADGLGKTVGNVTNTPENVDPEIVGQYHIAKMTYVDASEAEEDKVRIYSNNGVAGDILTMREYGWGDDEHFKHERRTIALPHIGVKVEVLQAKAALTNAKKVSSYLGEKFGILLARKKLYLELIDHANNTRTWVRKPNWLKTDNEVKDDPILKLSTGRYVTCRLEPTAKAAKDNNIYVFVKYVGICSIHVDYLVSGWINCDDLTNALDLSRDRFNSANAIYQEVIEKLNRYLEKEEFTKQTREHNTGFKAPKQLLELANLAMKISFRQIPDDLLLTGEQEENLPENPDDKTGNQIETTKEIEKRSPSDVVGGEEHKPSDPKGGTRKPRDKQAVTTFTNTQQRTPNIKMRESYEENVKFTLFFNPDNAEDLIVNTATDLAEIITKTSKALLPVVSIPLLALATIRFRRKDQNISKEAFDEEIQNLANAMWEES